MIFSQTICFTLTLCFILCFVEVMNIISAIGEFYADRLSFWLQVDKGISPEVVRSTLAERANLPFLAAKTACKVSAFGCYSS